MFCIWFRQLGSVIFDPTDETKRKALYYGMSVTVKRLPVQLPKQAVRDLPEIKALAAFRKRFTSINKAVVNFTRFTDTDVHELAVVRMGLLL